MILFSHATGNANARNAALALAERGLLAEFWTCVSWDPHSRWNRLLPAGLRQQLGRRALPEPLRALAHYHPWREMGRMLASRLGWEFPCRHERGAWSIDAVFQSLDRRVAKRLAQMGARGGVRGVYAYEDGAAATFEAARERGVACIYDLPIGYWRVAHEIYAEETAREPQWACTLTGMRDSAEKLARKDRELALADTVFVASSFTQRTIQAAPKAPSRIHVIPYGAPIAAASSEERRIGGPLRVFFAGSLSQRKGVSYLLKAAAMLGDRIELTLLGTKVSDACAPLNEALVRYRWIRSLPHSEVLREMGRHDVFVFPSLFEGFGLVILEAMAQGLPVITTSHTAGPDIIEDGVDGFIVPIRSSEAIAEKLDVLAADRPRLAAMREAAIATARRFTWENYQRRLAEMLAPLVTGAL
jgi:glycosyltransferase involved in cell wall biosynthesis